MLGGAENARPENVRPEFAGPENGGPDCFRDIYDKVFNQMLA